MAGVVYCAVSKTIYFKASLVSSIVFQRLNPGIPITIFHNQNLTEFLDLKYQLKSLGIDFCSSANDKSIQSYYSDSNWKRLGQITANKITLIRRNNGLIIA